MIEFVKTNWHFFAAGIILLALLAYWVFDVIRNKKAKQAELIELEQKLNQIEEEKKPEEKQTQKVEKQTQKVEKQTEADALYEVFYDEEKKDWVVKKQGSKRATKRTKTKQEALDVVKGLSANQEIDVVVKTKDGKVQK